MSLALDHKPAEHVNARDCNDHSQRRGIEGESAAVPESFLTKPGILADPNLTGRGSSCVRQAILRRVQQAYGNRAVQSVLGVRAGKGSPIGAVSSQAISIQRQPAPPRVNLVTPSVLELGVGGRDITATATIAPGVPADPPITWTINPGGAVPAGVSTIGTGRRVRVRAAQPGPPTVVGGTPITLRAALTGTPGDFADSAPIMLVQVTQLAYGPLPPLGPIPSLVPGVPPPNTGEPNRDGITGNTVVVAPTVLPGGRPPPTITFRRSLGATVAGLAITPGSKTGNLQLRVTDVATGARFDETTPSIAGGAPLMADFTINSVPTRVNALAVVGPLGPYGMLSQFGWAASDASGAGGRIIGEMMSLRENTLGLQLAGPGGWNAPIGFNSGVPNLGLAVPANAWQDQVTAGAAGLTPQATRRST